MLYLTNKKSAALVSAGLLLALSSVSTVLAQDVALTEGPATIWDGVYTTEQADRGRAVFGESCASCHGSQAGGGPAAPALTGSALDSKAGMPVSAMIDYMIAAMPPEAPGRLRTREYVDIMAYVLQLHGAPAGETELPPTIAALNDITIEPAPAEGTGAQDDATDDATDAAADAPATEEEETPPFNDGH